jgi:hypothetical protein
LTGRTRVYGHVLLVLWAAVAAAPAALLAAGPELDCASPAEARAYIALLRLAEIEGAEDIHRAAMWDAFGHCPDGEGGGPCRAGERRRFEQQWEAKRQAIEDKYRELQIDFERRCLEMIS